MDFLDDLNLDRNERIRVEVVLEENGSVEEKLEMLKHIDISDDNYEKIRKILKKDGEKGGKKSIDFLSLMDERARTLASSFRKNQKFDLLAKIVARQSDECKAAFEEFMRQQEGTSGIAQEISGLNITKNGSNPEKEVKKTAFDSSDEESDEETDSEEEEESQWRPSITPDFFNTFPKCTNILVLGETGVGKSTFINGLGNYLRYANMHEAKREGVEILITSSFLHSDVDYNRMRIECKPTIPVEEENEDTSDGQSSTQSPKAYQFDVGPSENRKTIRIIDTPGVGDVRGLEQEQMNFAKILSFIADYPEIHAILILLKPNNARRTVTYRYCINELLTHLHVSASRNIIFCFTNARQTFYQPGDTLPALEKHLQTLYEARKVRIPIQRETVFCFDNESFRFLCAWQQGARFKDEEVENFNTSWTTTVEETFRLFKRIAELPSHKTEDTLSVNNIRKVILAMARPLAEIAKNQMTNAQLIDEKIKEVEDLQQQGKTLSTAQLYVDQVVLTAKELPYPVTVCTHEKCVEIHQLTGSVYETYYKQKCHPHCYLTGVQTGLVPNPQIQGCACFYRTGINRCNVCSCDWTTHLHIRYELIKAVQKVQDPTVQDSIKNCDDKIKTTQMFIDAEKRRKMVLEAEARTISGHCAEFAAFLKANSIIPYNDVYKEYVEHLIKEENGKVSQGGSCKMLVQLQRYRDEYAQQVKILESHGTTSTNLKSIAEIYAMLAQLRQMKSCGDLIKEIEKLEILSVRKEHANRVTNVNIKKGWIDKIYDRTASAFTSSPKKPEKSGKKPGKKSKKSRR